VCEVLRVVFAACGLLIPLVVSASQQTLRYPLIVDSDAVGRGISQFDFFRGQLVFSTYPDSVRSSDWRLYTQVAGTVKQILDGDDLTPSGLGVLGQFRDLHLRSGELLFFGWLSW